MRLFVFVITTVLFPLVCFADVGMLGGVITSGRHTPPPFYNSANVIFSWNGDDPAGSLYGFLSDGTPILGVNNGSLTISTSYGESGSHGARLDAANKSLEWADGGTIIDRDGLRTIWVRIYLTAEITDDATLFEAYYSASQMIGISLDEGGNARIKATYYSGSAATNYDGNLALTTWISIGYSFDQPNADHAVYALSTWAEDLDEIGTAITNDLTYIAIGEKNFNDEGLGSEEIYIDKIAIMSGYQTGAPW